MVNDSKATIFVLGSCSVHIIKCSGVATVLLADPNGPDWTSFGPF